MTLVSVFAAMKQSTPLSHPIMSILPCSCAYESSWPRSDNPGFADVCFHLTATGDIEEVGSRRAEILGNSAPGSGLQIA